MNENPAFKVLAILLVFFVLLPATHLSAQGGKVYDELTLHSEILDMERKYALYLPPDYDHSERSYPVLYLLHGGGDDQTGWIQFGEVLRIADEAILSGKATPMIIVMPDANTGTRGYTNNPSGEWRYEDFFFEELMPHVENIYRIKGEKRYRAIAGLSMGGGGTFYYALHRPELFESACPLSASARKWGPEAAQRYLERQGNEGITDKQMEAWLEVYDIHGMIAEMPEEQKQAIRWYIDCGDDDFLYEGNALIHIAMRKNEIPHEYRVRDGGHTWTYWRESLPEVLNFISVGFHQGID
jgi:enterochelin esterase-like enzyme